MRYDNLLRKVSSMQSKDHSHRVAILFSIHTYIMKNVNTSNERIHPITKLKNKLKYVEDQPWHSERENDNLKISIKEDQKFIKFFMIFV